MSACEATIAAAVAIADQRIQRPRGASEKNGFARGGRGGQQQRPLAEVVEQQAGQHHREPASRIGRRPKCPMSAYSASPPVTTSTTEPRIRNACDPVADEEVHRVPRIDRLQHLGRHHDAADAQHGDGDEPDRHHRPEQPPDLAVPCFWTAKSAVSTTAEMGQTQWLTAGAATLTPFDGAQHRDRRRDDAVAVEQRGAEEPERDEEPAPAFGSAAAAAPAPAARECPLRRGCRPA